MFGQLCLKKALKKLGKWLPLGKDGAVMTEKRHEESSGIQEYSDS